MVDRDMEFIAYGPTFYDKILKLDPVNALYSTSIWRLKTGPYFIKCVGPSQNS